MRSIQYDNCVFLYSIDHQVQIDVDKMNAEVAESDRNFYDALESSKWMPIEQLEIF